jgi:hypothetical protein
MSAIHTLGCCWRAKPDACRGCPSPGTLPSLMLLLHFLCSDLEDRLAGHIQIIHFPTQQEDGRPSFPESGIASMYLTVREEAPATINSLSASFLPGLLLPTSKHTYNIPPSFPAASKLAERLVDDSQVPYPPITRSSSSRPPKKQRQNV